MKTQDLTKSIRARLSNIAKKRGVLVQFVTTEFLIERLLARLVVGSHLKDLLIFKGGFVAFKQYDSARYTIDLDALSKKKPGIELEKLIDSAIAKDLQDSVWFTRESTADLETQGEYGGVRFSLRTGIGDAPKDPKRAQIINLDIGFGDPVTPGPISTNLKCLLNSDEISWSVYPIETMIAEKLHALVSLQNFNSRSKDILDLCLFLPKSNNETLRKAVERTFKYRDTKRPANLPEVVKSIDLTVLEKGWVTATASVANAPSFQEAFQTMLDHLKKKL